MSPEINKKDWKNQEQFWEYFQFKRVLHFLQKHHSLSLYNNASVSKDKSPWNQLCTAGELKLLAIISEAFKLLHQQGNIINPTTDSNHVVKVYLNLTRLWFINCVATKTEVHKNAHNIKLQQTNVCYATVSSQFVRLCMSRLDVLFDRNMFLYAYKSSNVDGR